MTTQVHFETSKRKVFVVDDHPIVREGLTLLINRETDLAVCGVAEETQTALRNIEALKPEDVSRSVTIRGEPHTVLQAINRQIAHYAAHIGQIVFLAKHLRSSEWKTLSIPRGKSEEFKNIKAGAQKFERGVAREK